MPCINANFATETPGCKLASINSRLALRVVAAAAILLVANNHSLVQP